MRLFSLFAAPALPEEADCWECNNSTPADSPYCITCGSAMPNAPETGTDTEAGVADGATVALGDDALLAAYLGL